MLLIVLFLQVCNKIGARRGTQREQKLCKLKIEQLKEVCIQAKVLPEGKKHKLIQAIVSG